MEKKDSTQLKISFAVASQHCCNNTVHFNTLILQKECHYSKVFSSKGVPSSELCSQEGTYQNLLVLPESHCVVVNIDEHLFQVSNMSTSTQRIVHALDAELCQSVRQVRDGLSQNICVLPLKVVHQPIKGDVVWVAHDLAFPKTCRGRASLLSSLNVHVPDAMLDWSKLLEKHDCC